MGQLQDAQKDAEVTSEVTERELELEAQLVEARSIIQEQVLYSVYLNRTLKIIAYFYCYLDQFFFFFFFQICSCILLQIFYGMDHLPSETIMLLS